MTRRIVIRRTRPATLPGTANEGVAAAVAQHLLFAAALTVLLLSGLLGRDDLELGRLIRETSEPFVPFVLLVTGFFGLISCSMLATVAAIGKTGV
jgi:hypothetical protein